MKKLMIINWRWKNFCQNTPPKEIDNLNEGRLLFISYFERDRVGELKEFVNKKVNEIGPVEVLLLLHYNPSTDRQGSIFEKEIGDKSDQNFHLKTRNITYNMEFSTSLHYIYDKNGMIDTSKPYVENLNIANFEKVWIYYWDTLEFINHKKFILNSLLPLAIDIEGISEVEHYKEKYYNDVREELSKEGNSLNKLNSLIEEKLPRWEEIKERLQPGYKDFIPLKIINSIKGNDYSTFIELEEKYLDRIKDGAPNCNFLPNWLKTFVEILDAKIK